MKRKRSVGTVMTAEEAIEFTNNVFRILVSHPEAPTKSNLKAFQLIRESHFLLQALREHWEEASKAIRFPNEDPATFELYLSLVCRGTFDISTNLSGITPSVEFQREMTKKYQQLFKLFVLCDKLQDTWALNTVIDEIVRSSCKYKFICPPPPTVNGAGVFGAGSESVSSSVPHSNSTWHSSSDESYKSSSKDDGVYMKRFLPEAAEIKFIYENTTELQPIRRLTVDMWAYTYEELGKRMALGKDGFDKSFLFDLLKRVGELVQKEKPVGCPLCSSDYHEDETKDQDASVEGE